MSEAGAVTLEIGKRYSLRNGIKVELTHRVQIDKSGWTTNPPNCDWVYLGRIVYDADPSHNTGEKLAWMQSGAYAAHLHDYDIVGLAP